MVKIKKNAKIKRPPAWEEGCGNVFKDLGFDDDEAESLLARATLMMRIEKIIKKNGWSQSEAAKALGVKQPRIAEIMSTKVDCFSVDLLIKYLARLGKRVDLKVVDANRVA